MKTLAGALLVALVAAGCGNDEDTRKDQRFLSLTAHNTTLARGIADDRIALGHQMCDLLDRYDGDTARADRALASGYESTFTPSVVTDLRVAAVSTYCPAWKQ